MNHKTFHMRISLPPFPVDNKLVPQYGRGRAYFESPVPFTVPLLCWTKFAAGNFLFFIIAIGDEWLDWKLAIPQKCKSNYPMVPVDGHGKPIKDEDLVICNGYKECTVEQVQRRHDDFWEKTYVLMDADTWIPMKLADPFNLLGFTCFGDVQTVPMSDLPQWSMLPAISLAVGTNKPQQVMTPIIVAQLHLPRPVVARVAVHPVLSSSFKSRSDTAHTMYEKSKELCDEEKAALLVLISQRPHMDVTVKQILTDIYGCTSSLDAIALMRDYLYNCVSKPRKTELVVDQIDIMAQWCVDSTDQALRAMKTGVACEEYVAYFCLVQRYEPVKSNDNDPPCPVWVWISERTFLLLEEIDEKFYESFNAKMQLFTETCRVREAIEQKEFLAL